APPGPRGVPLLGYLPFFGDSPHLTFMKLREKYGNIFSIQMGSLPAVVIHGKDLIKEALVNRGDDFSGRPQFFSNTLIGNDTLTFGNFSEITILHKHLASSVLFKFANARKNPIEEIVNFEARMAASELVAMKGTPINPKEAIYTSVGSIIFQVCFGKDRNIREEDLHFKEFIMNSEEFSKFVGSGNPVDVMPYLRFVMPWKVTKFIDLVTRFDNMVNIKIEENKKVYTPGELRHLTDGLIAALKEEQDKPDSKFTEKRIFSTVVDILGAGFETVSTTLLWAILCLTKYPQVQERVQQEIDDVLGKRQPMLQDKQNMDYCMATINEIMRYTCLAPLVIPHTATKDTELCGYSIKKDTIVIPNLYSISHDKETWGDPDKFRPERYLDSKGQLDKTITEKFNVFSMGRRKCLGEFLARTEIFLFFTGIFQLCKFS
ncbi:hypothetical protein LOTGIDRAFT_54271, partial [Lottia gigantea]